MRSANTRSAWGTLKRGPGAAGASVVDSPVATAVTLESALLRCGLGRSRWSLLGAEVHEVLAGLVERVGRDDRAADPGVRRLGHRAPLGLDGRVHGDDVRASAWRRGRDRQRRGCRCGASSASSAAARSAGRMSAGIFSHVDLLMSVAPTRRAHFTWVMFLASLYHWRITAACGVVGSAFTSPVLRAVEISVEGSGAGVEAPHPPAPRAPCRPRPTRRASGLRSSGVARRRLREEVHPAGVHEVEDDEALLLEGGLDGLPSCRGRKSASS